MSLVIARLVADSQILNMAVTTFAQGLDVLKRGGFRQHMLTADPAGHHAMQLARNGFVHFVAGVA
jgi:acetoin utilization deacetylase AcuC-like enzyme